MSGASAEACRLVVCGPDRQIDLAVPSSVLVADLLPALLHHLGDGLADNGLQHGGWVLQRAGSAPLDEESSVAALGLYDGEIVYLRPRAEQLPEVDFDDLVDGVATGVGNRPGRWRPEMAGWAAQGGVAVLLAVGVLIPALPGPIPIRAGVAMLAAVLTLGLARGSGVVPGTAGVAFAGVAGLVLPAGHGLTSDRVLAGCATAAAAALVAAALLRPAARWFTALATALLLGVFGGAVGVFGGLGGWQAGAAVAVVATALVPAVPVIAFRLAGLRLAPLPTRPEHLQEDLEPEPATEVLARSRAVDAYMTALYGGLAAASTIGLAIMFANPGWAELTLASLLAVVLLLSARPMTSAWHRLALAVPAALAVAGAAATGLAGADPVVRQAALIPVAIGVWALIGFSRAMRARRLMPVWGRIGDLLLTVAAVAVLPVLLAVLGLYDVFRAIGG